ncbi:MAG: pyridoxamine 5'-phosphate oxidase family protein [Paracoccaceae bacterium]|nr:pyridoxamine 5'-phosphate oxidase family protein [Paracoccaceae bacterium]
MAQQSPFRPVDDEARQRARALLAGATHGALGVRDPASGDPVVSRIAVALDPDDTPMTLISELSPHTEALRAAPRASLLLGEPGGRGDPLTHPRITLAVDAAFVPRGTETHSALRMHWLARRPKSKLYIDFADFHLVRLHPRAALLNGGFGKAFELAPEDLLAKSPR